MDIEMFAHTHAEGWGAGFPPWDSDKTLVTVRLTAQGSRDGAPSLALAISCVARRLVLGQRAEEEVEAVREVLPPGARLLGLYSYGEISPYATGQCDLHNQTMTLTNIEER